MFLLAVLLFLAVTIASTSPSTIPVTSPRILFQECSFHSFLWQYPCNDYRNYICCLATFVGTKHGLALHGDFFKVSHGLLNQTRFMSLVATLVTFSSTLIQKRFPPRRRFQPISQIPPRPKFSFHFLLVNNGAISQATRDAKPISTWLPLKVKYLLIKRGSLWMQAIQLDATWIIHKTKQKCFRPTFKLKG